MDRIIRLIALLIGLAGCSKPNTVLDPKQYIVVFKKSAVAQEVRSSREPLAASDVIRKISGSLESRHQMGRPKKIFSSALQGAVYRLEDDQLASLKNDPDIAYIEKDQLIRIGGIQSSPEWGLDRLDQAHLPLDKKYEHDEGGGAVNAYVIDTGILISHQQFEGRAAHGADTVDNDGDATDCQGHGTHVAGSIASRLYGVAKNVKIFGVRVLDCSGSGTNSDVIAGVDWVTKNHIQPAVANMSLGGGASQALDDAIRAGVAAGVTFVVAAGNENQNACNVSPARVPEAITVGASTISDARASFSNFGTCVDVFAPGQDIKSLGITNITATDTMSGTSMASPHVAGVAALYLSRHPQASPAQVAQAIVSGAISGKISNPGTGSPNRLANARFLGEGSQPQPGPEPQPDHELKNGEARSGLSGAKEDEKYYVVKVPTGASRLTITISGGSGDADLYVKSATQPTLSSYSCRPYRSGNSETCTFRFPRAGEWHILIHGYTSYSGLRLQANW